MALNFGIPCDHTTWTRYPWKEKIKHNLWEYAKDKQSNVGMAHSSIVQSELCWSHTTSTSLCWALKSLVVIRFMSVPETRFRGELPGTWQWRVSKLKEWMDQFFFLWQVFFVVGTPLRLEVDASPNLVPPWQCGIWWMMRDEKLATAFLYGWLLRPSN